MSRTVMIVDDDADIRTSLELLFGGQGYDVLTAANGLEALAMLDRGPAAPDLVLLDLMMPVMNGWQVLDALRNHCDLADVPVVILSAVTSNRFFPSITWLKKPVDVDLLLSVVAKQIVRGAVSVSA